MNISKLRKKHNRYRCLKTISYLLGFPLFVLLVLIGSMALFEGDAFSDTKWYGVLVAVAVWAVSIILQIVISIITKSYNGRTLFMLIITLVVMVGGSIFFDFYATKKIDEVPAEYEKYGVEVDSYKYQTGWVITWTSRDGLANQFVDDVNRFCEIYNIEYKSSNFGKVNGDGSNITYDKEADAYYSENGLFADGYIFGFKQAVQVLIDYNASKFAIENDWKETNAETKEGKYVANGKNADEELEKALAKVDSSAEWISYRKTEEYIAAYGPDGRAYKHMLNVDRLAELVVKLSEGLSASGLLDNSIISGALNGVLADWGLSVDDLKSLTLDKVIDLINQTGLLGETEVTVDMVMDLLEDFSFYQDPAVKPKFAFIEDETIRTYAYANYYATVHGANVGSVLIGDNIGQVTMDASGYPGTMGYTLEQLYDLQARDEVGNSLFGFMIARRYALVCAGITALMIVLFYFYKRKEDETFAQIVNGKGGRR